MDITALIPVKRLSQAKSRMRPDLGQDTAALVLAMLQDVATAVQACPYVSDTIVVTDDPDICDAAAALGAQVWPDGPEPGLNAALFAAAARIRRSRPDAMLVFQPADCPAITGEDFAALAEACDPRRPTFVADAEATGTTTAALPPGILRSPRYGPQSRAAHLDDGWVELSGPRWRRMGRDVDRLADLRAVGPLGSGSCTRSWLSQRAPGGP